MTDAASRLTSVSADIAKAAQTARRDPADVRLIAVSKGRSAEQIEALIAAGQRDFGENRVQEAQEKWPALLARYRDVRLHFIGRLQSNKAVDAIRLFDAIHSVDRQSLVDALADGAAKESRPPAVYLQVNIGDEEQKGGCTIADLPGLVDHARQRGLKTEGLMAIPPQAVEAAPFFALLAKLADRHGLARLSMGMSSDFTAAVMLGSTDVRIGSALFDDQ